MPQSPLDALLDDYDVPPGHFDELLQEQEAPHPNRGPQRADSARPGGNPLPRGEALTFFEKGQALHPKRGTSGRAPRAHWEAFARHAGDLSAAQLSAAQARVTRQIHENGVTYNTYATQDGPARPWALDVLPYLVPAAEWDRLAPGLRQRARLLDAVAADLYGDQHLLRDGLIPPALVFGHPGFLRAVHGVRPPANIFLHVVAFDLARGLDGQWRVMDTRAQAPSGAGYALENRITVSRVFPDAFRELHVSRLAPFFRTLQETLLKTSPSSGSDGDGAPHVVLLTPGPYNETYFEHAYLARYLGFTLVEGGDLTVRGDRVYLKTVAGLEPVHGILRRLDDDFSDPLELRSDSAIGVPGLVQAWREGHVLVANAFGMGVLESHDLSRHLAVVSERLLGEPLDLPSALVAASASAENGGGLSHAPIWEDGRLESRGVMLRVFLVSDGNGDYQVMPGGLARTADRDGRITPGQRRGPIVGRGGMVSGAGGGSSKDTWVLADAPADHLSLLPGRLRGEDIAHSRRKVSSRAGENLFWLGRYAERAENGARLMRAVLSRLHQGEALAAGWSRPVVATCRLHGLLRDTDEPVDTTPHDLEHALIEGLFEARTLQSLAFNIDQTVRVAGTVRDRLSSDNWRVLSQLSRAFVHSPARRVGVAEALDTIDQAIISLVAVGGLEMAHMTRDDGWRFLSLGRHLERLLYVVTTAGEVAKSKLAEEPALLEWLLDLSDSIITYRARYMRPPEWLAVAELLLFDRQNPRSAAFQLLKLAKHVRLLPDADLHDLLSALEHACETHSASHVASSASHVYSQGELFPTPDTVTDFLRDAESLALRSSDAITLRYFSHVYESPHATAVL
jgi:uncharacterized circularly permuted ATP-grasp superfamily protein/uncharacterized alpha-E superfamily protein